MRLFAGLVAVILSSSLAFAAESKPLEPLPDSTGAPAPKAKAQRAKPGLRVVKILPESQQALVFDKARNTHLLVEVGSVLGDYIVEAIDDEDVTLVAGEKELVLSAPAQRGRSLREEKVAKPKVAAAAEAPEDPYAEPAVREVSAPTPIAAGDDGVRVVDAGAAFGELGSDEDAIYDAGPAPAPTAAPIVDAGPAPRELTAPTDPYADEAPPAPITPTVLSRRELSAALGDFTKLATLVRGSFVAQGVRIDAVTEGSLFANAGLRSGDVVTAVDGKPLASLDDAADLYSRAGSTRAANIAVLRDGKPVALRVLIH